MDELANDALGGFQPEFAQGLVKNVSAHALTEESPRSICETYHAMDILNRPEATPYVIAFEIERVIDIEDDAGAQGRRSALFKDQL
jgi:hypothetical protein